MTARPRCMRAPDSTPRASSPRCSKRSARTSRPKPSSSPDRTERRRRTFGSVVVDILPDVQTMKIYLAGPDVFLSDAVAFGRRKVALCGQYGLSGLYPLDAPVDLAA